MDTETESNVAAVLHTSDIIPAKDEREIQDLDSTPSSLVVEGSPAAELVVEGPPAAELSTPSLSVDISLVEGPPATITADKKDKNTFFRYPNPSGSFCTGVDFTTSVG